jgi:hypothetical protein
MSVAWLVSGTMNARERRAVSVPAGNRFSGRSRRRATSRSLRETRPCQGCSPAGRGIFSTDIVTMAAARDPVLVEFESRNSESRSGAPTASRTSIREERPAHLVKVGSCCFGWHRPVLRCRAHRDAGLDEQSSWRGPESDLSDSRNSGRRGDCHHSACVRLIGADKISRATGLQSPMMVPGRGFNHGPAEVGQGGCRCGGEGNRAV